MLDELARLVPRSLCARSGKAFYSGRLAFSPRSPLYVLGINPGGDPSKQATSTVAVHTEEVLTLKPDDWSEYRDESWRGGKPGTAGMQPRVLHLLESLGLSPGRVPCSNLVFVRSRRVANLGNMQALADLCWPFHARAIELLKPKAILCFGKTAGNYVKRRLQAARLCDEFVEKNNRRWRSAVFSNPGCISVIVATHPSVADWCVPGTDPSGLVGRVLRR
jgi:uracil-DNA glycosylase family 4